MCALLGDVLVNVKDLTKTYQDREILAPMTFTVHRGHRIGFNQIHRAVALLGQGPGENTVTIAQHQYARLCRHALEQDLNSGLGLVRRGVFDARQCAHAGVLRSVIPPEA